MLDPEELNERFLSWVQAINPHYEQEIISIDGKTARRSHDKRAGQPALHMANAWANKAGLTLGRQRSEEKSNEITAIPVVQRDSLADGGGERFEVVLTNPPNWAYAEGEQP